MLKRANKIYYKGTIESRTKSRDLLQEPGDFVIVKRGIPRLVILCCPCGCGDDLLINLDKRSGPAWRLYSKNGKYTLFPSYWRDTKCKSHFIIWNNRIYWCYSNYEYDQDWTVGEEVEIIVLEMLKQDEFKSYLEIADESGLLPWETLQACEQLSKRGLCIPKNGRPHEYFKKVIIRPQNL